MPAPGDRLTKCGSPFQHLPISEQLAEFTSQFGEPWLKGSATFDVSIVNKVVYHISKFIIYIGQMKDVLCYMFYVVCKHNKIIYNVFERNTLNYFGFFIVHTVVI